MKAETDIDSRPGGSGCLLLLQRHHPERQRLEQEVGALGWEVLVTADAGEAEAALAAVEAAGRSLDAVVVDVAADCPGQGLEAMRQLMVHLPRTPVLALVEAGAVQPAVRATQLGAVACLEKPVSGQALVGRLGRRASRLQLPSLSWMTSHHLTRVVTACGGNKSEAARILDVSRRGLQFMLQKSPGRRGG
jgi:ActR/RegA family two-component response regulator